MNVDWPRCSASSAPTRVKIRSHAPITARSAGTYDPTEASSASSAVCRMNVLLPAMLGPVISAREASAALPSTASLGTNRSPSSSSSTG